MNRSAEEVYYSLKDKFNSVKPYIAIPKDVAKATVTSAKELGLIQLLYHCDGFYSSKENHLVWAEISIRKLSRESGIHRNTLRKTIEALAKKSNYIIVNKVNSHVYINSPLRDENGFIVDYRTTFDRMNKDGLSLTERGVYLKLHLFWNNKHQCYPSLQRLAEECQLKVWQLSKILAKLHTLGYIRKMTVSQGCIKRNYYHILDKVHTNPISNVF